MLTLPNFLKEYNDEIVRLLGGPDHDEVSKQRAFESAWMTISKSKTNRDYPAIEKNLLRLLRVKRDVPNFDSTQIRKPLDHFVTDGLEVEPVYERIRHFDSRCNNVSFLTGKLI